MGPERSYQPRLVIETADNKIVKRLQWHDTDQGNARIFDAEPETTLIQRGLLRILQTLPIEEHL
jgi:putative cardiolipin synthase